jgi:predicted Zn-ribbon and HTH transcriptional regulator
LSEFGCETIGCLWCLPRIATEHPDDYKIAVGWYGREYLYRHLVDEFWELKEEFQWLRDYCMAFHNVSHNLSKLEEALKQYGKVITSRQVGQLVVGNKCTKCGNFWGDIKLVKECPRCNSNSVVTSLFGNVPYYRNKYTPIPKPSIAKCLEADRYVKPNTVGIFARGRKTYGRNLQPEFYIKLIELLESQGYNIIWLGEKQSTQACPVSRIIDYSRMPESRDLELTCAIISKLKFTIQFWTASTRLASMMGVPFILFETPMQIWGEGQEGYRLSLLKNLAPKKLAVCHFQNVLNNHDEAMRIVKQCTQELEAGNYEDVIGLVEDSAIVRQMKNQNKKRIGDG